MINANAQGVALELSKKFLKFIHTDRQMVQFTKLTGLTRGLNYSPTEEELADMNEFSRSILRYRENSDVLYPVSNADIVLKNYSQLKFNIWTWSSRIGETTYRDTTKDFRDGRYDYREFFEGLKRYADYIWPNLNK